MNVKRLIKTAELSLKKRLYLSKYSMSIPGTIDWLVGTEIKYGGIVTNVPRRKVSPKDPRTRQQLNSGGMVGGDRMFHHGYARKYSEYLKAYVQSGNPVTLVEIGILEGTGLALWCDLFENGRIIGLDIDLGHINRNMDNLKKRGAFQNNQPELFEFDQYLDNRGSICDILKGDSIDVCIDDGAHSVDSILTTTKSVFPHLADRFIYFIEDNKHVHEQFKAIYPDLIVDCSGELTIVSRTGA